MSVSLVAFRFPWPRAYHPDPAGLHAQFSTPLPSPDPSTTQGFQNLPHSCSPVPLLTHPSTSPAFPVYSIPLFICYFLSIKSLLVTRLVSATLGCPAGQCGFGGITYSLCGGEPVFGLFVKFSESQLSHLESGTRSTYLIGFLGNQSFLSPLGGISFLQRDLEAPESSSWV